MDLTGRIVVMVGSYDDDEPGLSWTVALFIDEEATDAQHDALADIFLGRAGGTPSRNYAPAISTVSDVRRAAIRVDHRWKH